MDSGKKRNPTGTSPYIRDKNHPMFIFPVTPDSDPTARLRASREKRTKNFTHRFPDSGNWKLEKFSCAHRASQIFDKIVVHNLVLSF
jgi:hypothetical protein